MIVPIIVIKLQFFIKAEARFYENIILASYTLDFDNIVVNATKKKSFRIMNQLNRPIDMVFD